ncbi:HAD-IIA family hydrolase [Halovivax sp.]|uniref:HAD-IIA family hydrolase n=1 Tax=Halovivax sp. TaxID=1935978 RepID=UPI0025BF863A|nr:HAD-IIA family hydrolase [Halovivax sp.]
MTAYEGAILDVDGTIVRGEELVPGAVDGLRAIDSAGIPRLLFSNNPTRGAAHYRERLGNHGIDVDPSTVLTSATVTAEVLAEREPEGTVFLIGHDRLRVILEEAGIVVTADPAEADVVVGSIDFEFDYEKLRRALAALNREIPFYGTDPDVTIPTVDGSEPGSGAILAAMEAVAGREPDAIFGKPSETAAERAIDRLGVPAADVLVVGDRLDTDVALGERAGMTTALVLTGSTDRASLAASSIEPDHVLDSVGDVAELLATE